MGGKFAPSTQTEANGAGLIEPMGRGMITEGRQQKWLARFDEVQEFTELHGRLPRRSGTESGERALWVWVHNQRMNYRNGTNMNDERREYLESVPGFTPQQESIDWDDALGWVSDYFEAHGKAPSSADPDPEIRRHGQWFGRQRGILAGAEWAKGYARLTEDQERRLAALPIAPPTLRTYSRLSTDDLIDMVEKFRSKHNRLPRRDNERTMINRVQRLRHRYVEGNEPFTHEQRERLNRIPKFVTPQMRKRLR